MRTFRLILVKPSHYDDDGYVIQWFRSAIPSNSLAARSTLAPQDPSSSGGIFSKFFKKK